MANSFEDLLVRVRAGDEDATAEFCRLFEAEIKAVARVRLRMSQANRLAQPSDVAQLVLASFFIRMALGQYTVSSPDKLRALLTRMVHNKVVDLARRPESRLPRLSSVSPGVVLPEPGDSGRSQLSDMLWRDACKRILARFSDSERHVSEMRAQGRTWEEVGATLGEKPNTVRVRFERAVKRVTRGLGLEELVYG